MAELFEKRDPVPPSSLGLVLDRLREAGLDASEAEVYAHLSLHGGARAAALASHLDWPRSKAYRVLEGMQARGIVVATMDRPIEFRAVPPEELFRRLEDTHEATLAMVRDARGSVLPVLTDWYHRQEATPQSIGGSFTILKGRQTVMRTLLDQLDARPDRVRIFAPVHQVEAVPGGLDAVQGLQGAARDGCAIEIICPAESNWAPTDEVERRAGGSSQVPTFMLFDDAYLVASVPPPGVAVRSTQHFLCTDAAGLVRSYAHLFQALWDQSSVPDQ